MISLYGIEVHSYKQFMYSAYLTPPVFLPNDLEKRLKKEMPIFRNNIDIIDFYILKTKFSDSISALKSLL
jgi:hypothetical protein